MKKQHWFALIAALALLLLVAPLAGAAASHTLSVDGDRSDRATDKAQGDHLVLNEFVAKGTEWIELYNPTSSSADISNWLLTSDYGNLNYTIPAGTVLPPYGYYVYLTGGAFLHNDGDVIRLTDNTGALVDVVGYGMRGAAPIPPQYWATARVPNGQDSDDDARDWNLDETETQGADNDAPPMDLGSSLLLNEFDNYPPSGNDRVEIYNPTSTTITLTNWLLSDGDAVAPIVTAVSVSPGGWCVLEETVDWTASMDFASADVGYLFRPDGTRVDQIGWYNEYEDHTFQRICDGQGPNDGYDWPSSGGGGTWFDLPATLGSTNTPGPVDVRVDKSGPLSVLPAGLITYVVTYQAVQPMPATALLLTDTLPEGVEYLGYTAVPTLTLLSTDPLVWDAGVRCGYATGILTLTAQVSDTIPPGTVLTNTVEISATGDVTLTNNTDAVTTTVVGSDVGIAKLCPANPLLPGQIVTYTLDYEVTGEPAQNLVITDVLPADVTYLADSSGVTPTQPTPGTLVWAMGTLPDSGSFLITAAVSTDPLTWTFTNRVWIGATDDTLPGNNYDTCSNQGPRPISAIQYTADPGGDGTYPSPFLDEYVYTLGYVTADSNTYGTPNTRYLIKQQDGGPWSGLLVYNGGDHPPVSEGDLVLLGGQVLEYYGMTELNIRNSVSGYQRVLSSGNPPVADRVTTADITPGLSPTSEQWEGVLIEVNCAQVTSEPDQYGEWGATDASGEEAVIGDWAGYAYTPTLGDELASLRGILFYSYGRYLLEPRAIGDLALAPQVEAVSPAPGAGACTDTALTVQFDRGMDPTSVEEAFSLAGPAGLVGVDFGYDPATWTAAFTPTAPLSPGSLYTATLSAAAATTDGVPLCTPYEWSFTTAPAPEVSFTAPPTACVDLPVQFTGLVHGGLAPFTYLWTFGDGGTADTPSVSHTYIQTGTFDVTLTVTDACGLEAQATAPITIEECMIVTKNYLYLPLVVKNR